MRTISVRYSLWPPRAMMKGCRVCRVRTSVARRSGMGSWAWVVEMGSGHRAHRAPGPETNRYIAPRLSAERLHRRHDSRRQSLRGVATLHQGHDRHAGPPLAHSRDPGGEMLRFKREPSERI